jgi:hypothetical protein
MPTTNLNQLKPHPAQMRTIYDLEALAGLTLQIYERGLNEWQPIVASAKPGANGAEGSDGYHIISGHRRHMAQLLALALRDWAAQRPDEEVDIEVVRTLLNSLVDTCGSLPETITFLLDQYGKEEVEFVTFEGSQKATILALHAANYGSEKPDTLGVAHSFRQAVAAGATAEEIARNSGQHVNFVRNHLALTEIPPELAQRIANGDFPMSVATAVADLPDPKRTGLAIFILANRSGTLTAKGIKACAATLKKWSGPQLPLVVKQQSQRNIARALVRLWGQVVEAYPEDAYAAAAMLIYRELHEEPWRSPEKLDLWFQALGGDTYNVEGNINWTAVVEHLLTEISCQTCPIGRLPPQQLLTDLSPKRTGRARSQGGMPLALPCRAGGQASRCLHGLAESDPFTCRVPWEWGQHPGVVGEGGDYRATSYEDLLTAWQAQQKVEERRQKEEVEAGGQEPVAGDGSTTTAAGAGQPAPSAPTPPVKESPIVKQRTQIADFMRRHEQLAASHPFATPCGRCRHRLDGSPTKPALSKAEVDESVPHCAWAGRLRNVTFKLLQPDDQNGGTSAALPIPVCRQFAPDQAWSELIPDHPGPPELPREWLKEQILHLVKDTNRYGSSRNAFEFLTGRPLNANENYSDWFSRQLAAQSGDLSDAQLFTLFIWAHAEWQRPRSSQFSLPVNRNGMQFAAYQERPWRVEPAA